MVNVRAIMRRPRFAIPVAALSVLVTFSSYELVEKYIPLSTETIFGLSALGLILLGWWYR